MVEYETTYEKICRGQELGQVIFPGTQNYTTSLTLCQNVHGNLVHVENEGQQKKSVDLLKNSSICSKSGIWIGWSDENEEGNWVSVLNSSVSLGKNNFKSWYLTEPNGGTNENCAIMFTNGKYSQ